MLNNLYEIFKRWTYTDGVNKNAVFVYSDPHFRDEEVKAIRKNYIGDEEQLKRINKTIGKNDTIIFLGDIGDVEFIKRVKGYKVLIMGNHDKGASNYKRVSDYQEYYYDDKNSEEFKNITLNKIKEFTDYGYIDKVCSEGRRIVHKLTLDNHLFDEVYEGPLMVNDRLILSHEPIEGLPKYLFNIHGHDHSGWFTSPQHFNVCAENINYTPVNLLSLLKKGLLKNIDSIHRCTIDTAIDRKRKRIKKEDN